VLCKNNHFNPLEKENQEKQTCTLWQYKIKDIDNKNNAEKKY